MTLVSLHQYTYHLRLCERQRCCTPEEDRSDDTCDLDFDVIGEQTLEVLQVLWGIDCS
jgi:hypothetical protein